MIQVNPKILSPLAKKYIWWKKPEESLACPEQVIAQVMNIGDYADVQWVASCVGDGVLKEVIQNAQAGQFNDRSWVYWHYRLGIAGLDQVPPLPVRRFI